MRREMSCVRDANIFGKPKDFQLGRWDSRKTNLYKYFLCINSGLGNMVFKDGELSFLFTIATTDVK